MSDLQKEADELLRITVQSIKTAKAKLTRLPKHSDFRPPNSEFKPPTP